MVMQQAEQRYDAIFREQKILKEEYCRIMSELEN